MVKLKSNYNGDIIKRDMIYDAIISHGILKEHNTPDKQVIYVDVIIGGKMLTTYCCNTNEFNKKWTVVK